MQAVITKYIGPTKVKGSRVKATASAGSITLHWDDSLNSAQNHAAAARALALKFGWTYGTWQSGGLPNSGEVVWVCADRHSIEGSDHFTLTAMAA